MKSACNKIMLFLFILLPSFLFSWDFGLVTSVHTGYGNAGTGDDNFDFRTDIMPRFSGFLGGNGEFHIGAGFTFGIDEEEFYFVPELFRTEILMNYGNFGFNIGRINYSDPLTFISSGLFDGLSLFFNSRFGNLSLGVWYTGLLYKSSANIIMTEHDQDIMDSEIDYGDFFDTYFSSKRLVASVEWEHPSIGEFLSLNMAVIMQLDLNDKDTSLNSQYFILKTGIPIKNFLIQMGGAFSLSQFDDGDDEHFDMSFAGELGFSWLFS